MSGVDIQSASGPFHLEKKYRTHLVLYTIHGTLGGTLIDGKNGRRSGTTGSKAGRVEAGPVDGSSDDVLRQLTHVDQNGQDHGREGEQLT